MRRTFLFAAAFAVAGFLGATVPVVHADDGEVLITIKGGKFTPSEVTVPAGKKIKITVRNEDATASEFESSDFHREKVVQPGSEISLFVGPLDAGTYEFFDDFHLDNRGHLIAK